MHVLFVVLQSFSYVVNCKDALRRQSEACKSNTKGIRLPTSKDQFCF